MELASLSTQDSLFPSRGYLPIFYLSCSCCWRGVQPPPLPCPFQGESEQEGGLARYLCPLWWMRGGIFLALLLSLGALLGCAPVIVGGAATGAMVAHDRRTAGTVIEDQAIEFKIKNAIHNDKELSSKTHIDVTSYNNVVLVTGEAPTEALRQRVIAIARNTGKVRYVYNEITVEPPSSLLARTTDAGLTTKVKASLLRITNFDPTAVKVVTEKGVVYLMGLVSRKEGNAAAETARRVGGVQKVVKLFEYID